MNCDPQATAAARQWDRVGIKHHHGINVPLFSLHSENSCGIGEFPDLIPLIDFCNKINFDCIQLLPINDTGRLASPYSPISALALNPLHLGLSSLPGVEKDSELTQLVKKLQSQNKAPRISYLSLMQERERFLQLYYSLFKQYFIESPDYHAFVGENAWLKGFALFKSIYISKKGRSQKTWPRKLQTASEELFETWHEQVRYHIFVQYLCHMQMQQVRDVADAKGIHLKGDLPILIGRNSADVWLHPGQFDHTYCAGAPPDIYSSDGQNWNMPIYNWVAMQNTGFHWWWQRLKAASKYYSIFRLDHIVGFYRIWAIRRGEKGRHGHYIPEDPRLWIPHGENILRFIIEKTEMLPIGEDLGIISPEIMKNMQDLGIAGTRVLRWERTWEPNPFFTPYEEYSPLSMTSVSTHDSEPLGVWWKKEKEQAKAFAEFRNLSYRTPLTKEIRHQILLDSHRTASLFHINLFFEYLQMFDDLSWNSPNEDRINWPGIVSKKNWSSKLRPSIEELKEHTSLIALMREMSKTV